MGKNKSKSLKRTEYAQFESIMARLDYKLKKLAEFNKKEKREQEQDEGDLE